MKINIKDKLPKIKMPKIKKPKLKWPSFKKCLPIAKKEFFGFINSPLAYLLTIPFLVLTVFLYFRTALLTNEASLRPFFETLPWFLVVLAPALTMRLLSEERKNKTTELLFAHPITELEIVLGKFLGAFLFYMLILVFTAGLPISLSLFSNPDFGQIAGQYFGALLVGGTFLALGITASAYVRNATSSFILAVFAIFLLVLSGSEIIAGMVPWPFDKIVAYIAVLPHAGSLSRGLIDIRDISYFLTIIFLALILATAKLSQRKFREKPWQKKKLNFAVLVVLALGVGLNVFLQRYPLRLDLTRNKVFSLSKGTKQTLASLEGKVELEFYLSQDLPAQVQPTVKRVKDLLVDYGRFGNVEIKTNVVEPGTQKIQEIQEKGIQPVTFNRIGTSKFETQTGFFGLIIKKEDDEEIIPFIENPGELEYKLTRTIRKFTTYEKKTIGIANLGTAQLQTLRQALEGEYATKTVTIDSENPFKDINSLLVIDSGASEQATASAKLKEYLKDNGKALVLADGVSVMPQMLTVNKSESKISEALDEFGIKINKDMVYDLQLNETVSMGQGSVRYLIPYPFWLKALVRGENFSPLSSIQTVSLAWPSSLSIEEKNGFKPREIMTSSQNAGLQKEEFVINPQMMSQLAPPKEKEIPLGAVVEKDEQKVAVIGNTNFIDDNFIANKKDNLELALSLIDWLSLDESVASIPRNKELSNPFVFTDPMQPKIIQYANLAVPSILVAGFAIFRLKRRKNLSLREY